LDEEKKKKTIEVRGREGLKECPRTACFLKKVMEPCEKVKQQIKLNLASKRGAKLHINHYLRPEEGGKDKLREMAQGGGCPKNRGEKENQARLTFSRLLVKGVLGG